jgi:hypothetical protein
LLCFLTVQFFIKAKKKFGYEFTPDFFSGREDCCSGSKHKSGIGGFGKDKMRDRQGSNP